MNLSLIAFTDFDLAIDHRLLKQTIQGRFIGSRQLEYVGLEIGQRPYVLHHTIQAMKSFQAELDAEIDLVWIAPGQGREVLPVDIDFVMVSCQPVCILYDAECAWFCVPNRCLGEEARCSLREPISFIEEWS